MSSLSSTMPPEPSESLQPSEWLELGLKATPLPEHVEGYLLGRGLREATIHELEMGVWTPPDMDAPMEEFRRRYGPRGERLKDSLVYPLRDGRGVLLGFEARSMEEKLVTQFKLQRAFWNPVFIGLPRAMERIWDGADVWIGEGLFDIAVLEHIIPQHDVTLSTLTAKVNQHHIEFFKRFVRGTVHMVFDRDEKGRKATEGYIDPETGKRRWGAIESMDRVKDKNGRKLIRCRDVYYRCPPGCKDPGDIWERFGDKGLREAFQNSI